MQKVNQFFSSKPDSAKRKQVFNFDTDDDAVFDNVFAAELMRYAAWRAFIVTQRRFLGFALQDVRPGDVVCVVRGSLKPLILRQLPHGRYELVGECYVHGIMDGSFAGVGSSRQVVY